MSWENNSMLFQVRRKGLLQDSAPGSLEHGIKIISRIYFDICKNVLTKYIMIYIIRSCQLDKHRNLQAEIAAAGATPVEDKTNGEVFFETVYLPDPEVRGKNKRFDNVVLKINNGVIAETDNEELTDLFKEFGPENTTVCELGLGMNPGVTSLCGCALLDEKMIGTFHLGIGDNTMFGGANEADDHNDIIGKGILEWK